MARSKSTRKPLSPSRWVIEFNDGSNEKCDAVVLKLLSYRPDQDGSWWCVVSEAFCNNRPVNHKGQAGHMTPRRMATAIRILKAHIVKNRDIISDRETFRLRDVTTNETIPAEALGI